MLYAWSYCVVWVSAALVARKCRRELFRPPPALTDASLAMCACTSSQDKGNRRASGILVSYCRYKRRGPEAGATGGSKSERPLIV